MRRVVLATLVMLLLSAGCSRQTEARLRLATTTSTYDSGLLQAILPDFESEYGIQVDVVAVGTGQAIALGERGDADVLLVHDMSREEAFVEAGHGEARRQVMYNDFVLVGPPEDPAAVSGISRAAEALARIMEVEASFVSRGDDSGTHGRELALWRQAEIQVDSSQSWYESIGQGMGETLQFASERGAYTLSDRGTYLSHRGNLDNLIVVVGGESIADNHDPSLRNPYGVIAVNPELHPGVNAGGARQFVAWITSYETQVKIADFGDEDSGQPLFYPDSEAWNASNP